MEDDIRRLVYNCINYNYEHSEITNKSKAIAETIISYIYSQNSDTDILNEFENNINKADELNLWKKPSTSEVAKKFESVITAIADQNVSTSSVNCNNKREWWIIEFLNTFNNQSGKIVKEIERLSEESNESVYEIKEIVRKINEMVQKCEIGSINNPMEIKNELNDIHEKMSQLNVDRRGGVSFIV